MKCICKCIYKMECVFIYVQRTSILNAIMNTEFWRTQNQILNRLLIWYSFCTKFTVSLQVCSFILLHTPRTYI